MMSLEYYLCRSAQGDALAAYQAARIMQFENHSEYLVQAQLRKAASYGSVDAMRWLGFLGLNGKLLTPQSTITNPSYYNEYTQAYHWFTEGALHGDTSCIIAVSCCLQYGIGVKQDAQMSEAIMSGVKHGASAEALIPIILLFNLLLPASAPLSSLSQHSLVNLDFNQQGGPHGETPNI